ncbi:MAG TPA: T9SS type A sorting domain-containing protein [Flavobacterium sp.]|nr:T9SS type A sorting domain-containing protein [Flavobacterium sp.]
MTLSLLRSGLLACLSLGTAQAQVTYHDETPDVSFTMAEPPGSAENLYPIDLDGNGTYEYNIRWDAFDVGPLIWYMHLYSQPAQNTSRQFLTKSNNSSQLEPLVYGAPINATRTFTNGFDPMFGTLGGENFQGLGERYAGFRATISGTTYYGWIRVMLTGYTLTVQDYAFTTNTAGLFAGEGGALSASVVSRSGTAVLAPNPARDVLSVDDPGHHGEAFRYRICDTSGKIALKGESTFGQAIDLARLAAGTYLLRVERDGLVNVLRFIRE